MQKTLKNVTKKIFAVAFMAVCFFACSLSSVQAATAYDGTPVMPEKISAYNYADYGFNSGNYQDYVGYYGIRNAAEMYGYVQLQNEHTNDTFNVVLTADIVINSSVRDNSGNVLNGVYKWEPIDRNNGIFDGLGHSISGIYTEDGFIENNYGTIKNLTIKNSYYCKSSSGGICNRNYNFIDNCHNYAEIESSVSYVGGICGQNTTVIQNCSNVGTIIGESAVGGINGICEWGGAKIKNCYNVGTIISTGSSGGIVGCDGYSNNAFGGIIIENCYNTGRVSGNNGVGGISGFLSVKESSSNYAGEIYNCYNTGKISGATNVGGINGRSGKIYNSYNSGNVTGSSNVGGIVGDLYYATVENCYYLSGTASDDNATAKNSNQFASGEVCFLLNESKLNGTLAWHQTIGKDNMPTLDSKAGTVYVSYKHNETTPQYSNTHKDNAHELPNGEESHDQYLSYKENGNGTYTYTCTICGYQKNGTSKNGMQKDSDGKWYFYKNNKVDTSKNGLVYVEGKDWNKFLYFEKGCWIKDKYDFVKYGEGEFLIANGTVADMTGLVLFGDSWYYLANGQLQNTYTGLAEYDGEWFYVEKGILPTNYNGLQDYDGSKFLIAAGRVLCTYSGLFENTDGKWYYIASGQVQTQYTGLAEYDGSWFYLEKGVLNKNYTGWVSYNGSQFYVSNGAVIM